jgi:hypothetical protein
MNPKNLICSIALSCTIAALLSACSSAPYHKSDAAALSLHDAANEVDNERQALDQTMAALDDLVNNPAADLRPQFERFNHALARFEHCALRAESRTRNFEEKHSVYLAAWDKEISTINYDIIRERTLARREEVASQFESVDRRSQEADAVVRPLIDYLRDLQIALGADLTERGLAAVKDIEAHAADNVAKVRSALEKLSAQLMDSGTSLSSVAWHNPRSATVPSAAGGAN